MFYREIVAQDIWGMASGICKRYVEEMAFSIPYVATDMGSSLAGAVVNRDVERCWVVEDKGQIVAMLYAVAERSIYNHKAVVVRNLWTYVDKEYRGKLISKKLTKLFKAWAKELGSEDTLIGTISEIDASRTKKLYEKLGFELIGYMLRAKS